MKSSVLELFMSRFRDTADTSRSSVFSPLNPCD